VPSPLNVKRNDYHNNRKKNDVKTPTPLADFIAEKVTDALDLDFYRIVDVACGNGVLSRAFFNLIGKDSCDVTGIDNNPYFDDFTYMMEYETDDFLRPGSEGLLFAEPDLVVCNPPFNQGEKGKSFLPELYMDRIFSIWPCVPLVLFAPMGMLLNQRMKSKRWKKLRDQEEQITSILPLPLDVFEDVEFHSFVLFFNIRNIPPVWYLTDEVINKINMEGI